MDKYATAMRFIKTLTLCYLLGSSSPLQAERVEKSGSVLKDLVVHHRFQELIHLSLLSSLDPQCDEVCQVRSLSDAARGAIHIGDFEGAELYLKRALKFHKPKLKRESLKLLAYTYLIQNDWDRYIPLSQEIKASAPLELIHWRILEVSESMHRHNSDSLLKLAHDQKLSQLPPSIKSQVDQYLEYSRKSPYLAGLLNVLPGLGFSYLGMYQSAALSLFLTVVSGWSTVELFKQKHYATATGVGLIFSTFYLGGILSAGEAAAAINDKRTLSSRQAIRDWAIPSLSFSWTI